MRSTLKLLFITVIAFIFTGCATIDKPSTVVTKHVYVEIPMTLLLKCNVPIPFSKEEYLAADWSKREDMFSNLVISQYKSLEKCNNQMSSLKSWNDQQKGIYNKE